jgi:hypothetical protein
MSRSNREIPGGVLYGMDITSVPSMVNMQCNHYQSIHMEKRQRNLAEFWK